MQILFKMYVPVLSIISLFYAKAVSVQANCGNGESDGGSTCMTIYNDNEGNVYGEDDILPLSDLYEMGVSYRAIKWIHWVEAQKGFNDLPLIDVGFIFVHDVMCGSDYYIGKEKYIDLVNRYPLYGRHQSLIYCVGC